MIIVTGASKGIGRAIASRLHNEGEEVLGISRSSVETPFNLKQIDVGIFENLRKLALELRTMKIYPKALINAAGVASMNLALMTPEKVTQSLITTNLLGTIYSCQNFAPLMIRNGSGVVINFSTMAVNLSLQGEAVYTASKAGVESFSKTLARELSPHNIRVNCISPGPMKTDLTKGVRKEQIDSIISQQIIRKQFTPDDVCDVVNFLLSNKSTSLSGQVFHIGGI